MRIVFISNYFNHHQKFLCNNLYELTKGNFRFVETSVMSEERVNLGYGNLDYPKYVIRYSEDNTPDDYSSYIKEADAVILGSVNHALVIKDKIVFRYTERLFKKNENYLRFALLYLPRRIVYKLRNPSNYYLLCAGAYVASDYRRFGLFKDKAFRWGYFPETYHYDVDKLLSEKKKNKLLWCGRLIDWKHPEYAIKVAKHLKELNYEFKLDIIGSGPLYNSLNRMIDEYGLQDYVKLLGSMKPEKVRGHMEESGILLFTSNRQEGWGAVLNEAMNSACAVVACESAGSVPYLIENNVNGLTFKENDINSLYKCVTAFLDNEEFQKEAGKKAYYTITQTWNSEFAAKRLYDLIEAIQRGQSEEFKGRPCSRETGIKE